jgi:hypothetical protein
LLAPGLEQSLPKGTISQDPGSTGTTHGQGVPIYNRRLDSSQLGIDKAY